MRNEPLPENLQSIVDTLANFHESRMYDWLDRQEELRRPKNPRLSLARTVLGLSRGKLNGEDLECLEETARRNNLPFDALKPYVEFRDLSAAVASAGGYLKQTEVREAVDILRPWSVTARSGMFIESGLVGDIAIPKFNGEVDARLDQFGGISNKSIDAEYFTNRPDTQAGWRCDRVLAPARAASQCRSSRGAGTDRHDRHGH